MKRTLALLPLAAALTLSVATQASAWQFIRLVTPLGDKVTAVLQPAENQPGVALAIGCDGDRWRQVVLLPRTKKALPLSPSGQVRLGFSDQLSPPAKWQVRKIGDGRRMYSAPAPSDIARMLVQEEQKSPNAVLRLQVTPEDAKPAVLRFPLAGLRQAIRKDLWQACKLDIYLDDPEDAE